VSQLVDRVRIHETAIRALGVSRLSIFGSRTGPNALPTSDLDIIAGFSDGRKASYFDLARVKLMLEESLQLRVDILPEGALSGRMERVGMIVRVF